MLIDRIGELSADQRIIIAYDGMTLDEAATLHAEFSEAGFHPIAKANSLATRPGLDAVMARFNDVSAQVMFDPKHHDTNRTMFHYITEDISAEPVSPLMVTLHASNGMDALKEAARARKEKIDAGITNAESLNLLGITVLTSLDDDDVVSIFGEGATALDKFVEFAHRASDAGLQGIVSSGKELVAGYKYQGLKGLLRVIPGIELPEGVAITGQKRLYTPDRAIEEGAHFVVIGSAITKSKNKVRALEQAVKLVDKAA